MPALCSVSKGVYEEFPANSESFPPTRHKGRTLPDLNSKLASALEEEGENLLKVLRSAIDAEKLYTVVCPRSCCKGYKMSAKMPDVATMLKAAQWWTEYVHGKASSKPQVPKADPKAVQRAYEDMTDEELAGVLTQVSGDSYALKGSQE